MVTNVDLDNEGPALIGTALAFTPLAGVALALRFFTKWVIKATFGLDDWFILIGTALFFITEGVEVWGKFLVHFPRAIIVNLIFLSRRLCRSQLE